MVWGSDAFFEVVEGAFFPNTIDHIAVARHLDAKELVALAILSGCCLKETGQAFDLAVVA